MTERQTLPVAAVRQQLLRLSDVLSKADFDRLEAMLPLFKPDQAWQADLAACLAVLSTTKDPLADFRAFRLRLRQAARKAGLDLVLEVDSRKRSAPQGRRCWFTQPPASRTADDVATFSQQVIAGLDTETAIKSRAVVSGGVQVCALYDTQRDTARAQQLLELLEDHCKLSRRYVYASLWHASTILPGENRAEVMQAALHRADVIVLLVSPTWLSQFEPGGDVRACLADQSKLVVPVVLENVNEALHALYSLEGRELFRLRLQRGSPKSFAECDIAQKKQFAQALFQRIEQRLDPALARQGEQPVQPPDDQLDLEAYATLAHAWKDDLKDLRRAIPARAQEASLRTTLEGSAAERTEVPSVVALEALQAWACDPHGAPYCVILGEYGIGKTTTLKQLTHLLLEQRRNGQAVPLPIFIDLRLHSPTIHAGTVPNLDTLLQEMLDQAWTTKPAFTAQDILRLVRDEGAILIFDGLDEKLVHLDETQGRAFLRTLWSALPPFEARPERAARAATTTRRRGRLIFSCRSHYFKTLRDQNAMLRGEDREGVRASDYRAWVLLPFDEEQMRQYLAGVLGPERVEATLALFAAVHNLRELAERPYLLSLMASHIGELERQQANGEVVWGVTLYDSVVHEWLARDGGKHHVQQEDKLTLMEDIAADMWRDGAREWTWRQVRAWLGTRLARDEVLRIRYNNIAPELLEEDFRTATFVLRPDSSQESFRFAHTSLQEYFLARYLLRGLAENTVSTWEMRCPSPETLDFLGQLLATTPTRQQETALHALETLLGDYRPQATDIALRYWLLAVQQNMPAPMPWQVDLHGADLSELTIRGHSRDQRLNLVDANLSETQLVATRFAHVDLSGANLTRAQAERAEFHHVLARDITVVEANMTAAIWRYCDALGLRGGASATWYECQWIACDLDATTLPEDFGRQGTLSCTSDSQQPTPSCKSSEVTTVFGHCGMVLACGYSPDGAYIVSGADDNTVKVWEAHSGKCLRTLQGHSGVVRACGYSPDGAYIVSGAGDGMVKVWEARSGKCLHTLQGHSDWMYACSYSPDGAYIVSGAGDGMVKVWEAHSGKCLRTLQGHSDWVYACSYSPDGAYIVSGAKDNTVKVWEAHSGKCLRTLQGHSDWVKACGYSPDGAYIVSGADDRTVKAWEARTGELGMTMINAPDGQTAAMDERHNRILAASAGAWRYLGWRYFDPQANRLRVLPAEHFGPLPGMGDGTPESC